MEAKANYMELIIDNLSIRYNKEPVIRSVNANFQAGITCLLGENGSGKSTLLKAIYLLVKSCGKITFGEKPLDKNFILQNISYLPQQIETNLNLSVTEVVLLGYHSQLGLIVDKKIKKRTINLLESLEIAHLKDKEFYKLSGGQKKLTYLAQSLLKKPKILLLDEPCNSLDLHNQLGLFNFLRSLEDIILIIAMHDVNFTIRYADKIIFLKNGTSVFVGGVDELTSSTINSVYNLVSNEFSVKNIKQYFIESNLIYNV